MATILVVDDDPGVRDVIELSLDGYDVLLAEDGLDALDQLAREDVDVVVLDIMMPRLDGIATLRRIRGGQRTADIPVVLLSARGSEDTRAEGAEAGADAYVTKPFEPDELVATIEAVRAARAGA